MNPSGSRRAFLKQSATVAAGATALGVWSAGRMAHAAGSDTIKVVLIGCGGRGNGAIRDCMNADSGVRVIGVADAFEDRARGAAEGLRNEKDFSGRVDIPSDRVFFGLDAYQKALAAGPDMAILATPPGFRPSHYAAAIEAGKHVFMEKPCCVDAPGYRTLWAANAKAESKGLKVGVGFQRRHTPNYVETVKRIHDGAIGELTLLRGYWNGDGIWNNKRNKDWTEMQYQVRNWYHFCWLSGDNICEQHIHNLDVCNWVFDKAHDPKKAHPVKANGMGACTTRYVGEWKGTGQIFDQHFVEFTYADGTKLYSQCRHIPNTWGGVFEAAHGTLGESNPGGSIRVKGGKGWNYRGPNPNSMVQEHKDLTQAIRNDKPYHEGWHGANSSMTAVLGRMATYSGKEVEWDDAVKLGTSEFPTNLAWDAPAPVQPDKDGNYPIPIPGIYKAY
jgi:myo-inositol 2-dehydrogenase/D-chiro-inositol 1-dehydrogenase